MPRMSMDIGGLDEWKQLLNKVGSREATRILARSSYRAMNDMMRISKRQAPVRNRGGGTLRASGTVSVPEQNGDGFKIEAGYGGAASAYAKVVHDNPRTGKTGGVGPKGQKYRSWSEVGKWQYLKDPFEEKIGGGRSAQPALIRKLQADFEGWLRQQGAR